MTQASPTYLLYERAISLLQQLNSDYQTGVIQDVDDLSFRLRDLLNQFTSQLGQPAVQYEPVVETEPPLSAKQNRLWEGLRIDLNSLQKQADFNRAGGIFAYNLLATEIAKYKAQNARLLGKMKTLQLYSGSHDPDIIEYGGDFSVDEFFDASLLTTDRQASVVGGGTLCLGRQGDLKNLSQSSTIRIMEESNGFIGNNQVVQDPSLAPVDPVSHEVLYSFVAQVNRAADPKSLTDGNPSSYFEYENYFVKPEDRKVANNLNFTYRKSAATIESSTLTSSDLVDWAIGPANGVLKLGLEFTLSEAQSINYLEYSPYGLELNSNYPVLVRFVEVSPDGTSWIRISPDNVWIGANTNITAARTAANVTVGIAAWTFDSQVVKQVRIHLEQPNPIDAYIGHLYYLNTDNQRVEGPHPPLTDPSKYLDPSFVFVENKVQKREVFTGKRWAIGIRDLLIQQVQYQQLSERITNPIRVGGLVDRVALGATIDVPSSFPTDQNWVKFFITPNDGVDWFEISRIQDDFLGLPEIIAFNDPTPVEFREQGVAYYNVSNAVSEVRLKIELSRPAEIPYSTPAVRDFKVRIRRRS